MRERRNYGLPGSEAAPVAESKKLICPSSTEVARRMLRRKFRVVREGALDNYGAFQRRPRFVNCSGVRKKSARKLHVVAKNGSPDWRLLRFLCPAASHSSGAGRSAFDLAGPAIVTPRKMATRGCPVAKASKRTAGAVRPRESRVTKCSYPE